jgi:hypothetical protein
MVQVQRMGMQKTEATAKLRTTSSARTERLLRCVKCILMHLTSTCVHVCGTVYAFTGAKLAILLLVCP